MILPKGSLLQNGKYSIEKVLGQGGFGITYLATQVGLNRKVAIKEFFMKEYCNRDEATSHVSVPSVGSVDLVAKFRQKFIKEAQTLAEMETPISFISMTYLRITERLIMQCSSLMVDALTILLLSP